MYPQIAIDRFGFSIQGFYAGVSRAVQLSYKVVYTLSTIVLERMLIRITGLLVANVVTSGLCIRTKIPHI